MEPFERRRETDVLDMRPRRAERFENHADLCRIDRIGAVDQRSEHAHPRRRRHRQRAHVVLHGHRHGVGVRGIVARHD